MSIGFIQGIFGMCSMFIAIEISKNTILDFRQLALILSAFFGGFPSAILTSFFLGMHRLFFVNGFNEISIIGTISILVQGIGLGLISTYVYRVFYKWILLIGYSLLISNLTFLIVLEDNFSHILIYFSSFILFGGVISAIVYDLFKAINTKLQANNTTARLTSIFETTENEKVYRKVLEEIMHFYNCEFGSIMLAHGSLYKIYCTLEQGNYNIADYILREGDSESTKVFETNSPLVFSNWNYKPPNGKLEKRLVNEGILSSMHFPIIYKSKVIACINLGSLTPFHFTKKQLEYTCNLNSIISFGFTLLDSESRFKTITQSTQDAIILADQHMRIISWNKGAKTIFGYTKEEAMGQDVNIIVPDQFKEAHNSGVERFLQGEESKVIGNTLELKGVNRNGIEFPIELTLNKWKTGGVYFFSSIIRDITSRKNAEASLLESEERNRKLIELSPDSICVYQGGKLIFANDKAATQIGVQTKDLIGTDSLQFLAPEYHERIKELIRKLNNEKDSFSNEEIAILRVDGKKHYYDVSASLVHFNSKPAIMTTFRDISERKAAKQQLQEANQLLKKLSNLDGLTSIPNRRFFDEKLDNLWKESIESHQPLSLIFCDIDFFKEYNDTYGHLQGDECLKIVAKTLLEAINDTEYNVARYGGEEFVLLLCNTNTQKAKEVALDVMNKIHSMQIPHSSSKIKDIVTLSMGIATMRPKLNISQSDLIDRADKALYIAKSGGRDRYFTFNNNLNPLI